MSIKTHTILVLALIFGGFAWVIATEGRTALAMIFVAAVFFAAIVLGLRAVISTFTPHTPR